MKTAPSQVVRWNVHVLGLAWYSFVFHAYCALTFLWGGGGGGLQLLEM